MSRWFRFYGEALNDHKVQSLSPELFKTWVNLLCVASLNNGLFPSVDRLAFELRVSAHEMQSRLDDLILAGLIDVRSDRQLEPHNWSERQWKSDDSKERVRKHRALKRQRNDDVTVTVTSPDTESDTDTEAEEVQSRARAQPAAAMPPLPDRFMDRMVEAAGECLANPVNCQGLLTEATPLMWIEQGCDFERDVLPSLRAASIKHRGKRISSWSYFTAIIAESRAKRLAGLPSINIPNQKQSHTLVPRRRELTVDDLERIAMEYAN